MWILDVGILVDDAAEGTPVVLLVTILALVLHNKVYICVSHCFQSSPFRKRGAVGEQVTGGVTPSIYSGSS